MVCCCSFGDDGDLTEFGKVSAKGLADLPWLDWWTGEKEDMEILLFSDEYCDSLLFSPSILSKPLQSGKGVMLRPGFEPGICDSKGRNA